MESMGSRPHSFACRSHIFSLTLSLAALVCSCGKQQAAAPTRPSIPVVIGKVTQKTMPVEAIAVGNVEAISTVAIKAQVVGELQEVHFKEGDFVRKEPGFAHD